MDEAADASPHRHLTTNQPRAVSKGQEAACMRLPLLVIGITLVCSGSPAAQTAGPARVIAPEFPASEFTLLNVQQRGDRLTAAALALAREPDTTATLARLIEADRIDDALGVAKRIVGSYPDRLMAALTSIAQHNSRFHDKARGHPEALAQIARDARRQLTALPREEAARAAQQIMRFEPRQPGVPRANPYEEVLAEFLGDWQGTEAARLAEVDRLTRGRPSYQQVDALQAFARAHVGTAPGAKALYSAGHQLAVNVPITGVEPRGSDPTERFMRVLAIAKELESGAYGRNEWVERAPELVSGLFASNPVISPANVGRLATEYVAFARSHLGPGHPDPADSPMAYLLTTKLAELHKTQGDPIPPVERTLDRLYEETGRAEFAFMKATFYLRTAGNEPARRTALRAKAAATLRPLSESGRDLYHRKALATLACLELDDRDYGNAAADFARYVERYPSSPYAWLAALRVGTAQAALDDWRSAAVSYRAAATRYRSLPLAPMLGHEYAARSLEATGDFVTALSEHEAALRAWDPRYAGYSERELTLQPRPSPSDRRPAVPAPAPVSRDALAARIAQLRASLAHPSGALLERGRWLVQQQQRAEAVEALASLLRQFPRSPLASQARALSQRARLETALTAADVEAAAPDPAAALNQLTALVREPYDEAVCVAGIARATLLTRDRPDEARTAMRTALSECRTGGLRTDRQTPTAFEADVVAVRNAVFKPLGGGILGTHGWDSYKWPASPPPFLLVSATLTVKTPGGGTTQLVVRDPVPALDNVVYISGDQLHLLNVVMTALGGTKRFAPASIMSTPNQPAGAALDVLAFWKQFFPAMPGHWGGWELEAFPRIGAIEFLDDARTRAAVPVTIGYSGATIVLEKRQGVWQTVELTNQWIT
jgi:TolA-binding protein